MTNHKQFIIDQVDNRCWPVDDGKFFVEYRGEPPQKPIRVIEYEAYLKLEKLLSVATNEIVTLRAIAATRRGVVSER